MRNKYVVWSLVLTMLISNLFLTVGSPAPVSAAGGPNLALGKNVSASGYTQTYSPNNVNDSNQGTYWESTNNAFPQWIQVDLGANTNVDQIVLKLPTAWGTRTQTLAVQGSTNGSTFTDIVGSADYEFNPSVAGNSVTINFTATNTRYVRLNVTANTGWPAAQLSEFEVYGASGPTPTPSPSATATPVPTTSPTAVPTATPTVTPSPTATPTATPIVTPSPTPTPTATPVPTATVTPSPTASPTATPTPPTGSNIAIGKAITASSSTLSFVAANANDNDTNTYWEGGSNPSSLTLDLGANHNITSIVLKLNPGSAWSTRTQTIQVLGHNQDTTTFSNLVAAQSYTFNPASGNTVTIPVTATVKRLQLNITANSGAPAGQIAEFQVFGTPAPNPDLTITGISWTPTSVVENNAITLNATVKNIGSAGSPAAKVNFYLNNELAGSATIAALTTGSSATVSVNAGTKTAGTYTVSAKVDENNEIIEENKANNSYTHPSPLVVAPITSSDLVGTVSWTPGNPTVNNPVAFTVNLKNQGNLTSAGGAHGVTVVLKNAAGATVQTYNGSYSGTLAPGASVNVSVGTWTAAIGNYTVTTTVAVDANEAPVKQTNNVSTTDLTVYSARGASMPYTRYDTEDATRGGGATLQTAPTFDQALIASEASGQSYIALPSNGSYAQWTVRQGEGGAGVTMRFTMPDSANGMGLNGALDVYVNGTKAKTVPLTSYYNWQYFSSDQPGDTPGAGRPLFRFDEVHWKLDTALKAGDTIRIQKNNGDSLEYGVDFLEIEPVPTAIARPANSVSVTDFGAVANDGQDDLAAFEAAVQSAVATGKTLYIPEGTFHLSSMWKIGTPTNKINDIKILGAGIWHTNIQFTNPNISGGGISFRVQGKLDFSNIYMNSNLRSRYHEGAIYKAFMDNFGKNSIVSNVWVEHFECGFWVGDYAHTPAIIADGLVIENSRIRNNLADGVNFAQGTSNSTVRNSSIRNNGDDGLAVWTSNVNGAPAGVNNTFSFNTIENNWRAAAIAFFGGSGHKATNNLIVDTVGGSAFRMNTVFPGYHFQNNTGILFSDTTIINSGTSKDLYNGERGAIDLEASNDSIKNVTFTNIDIQRTQRSAIQFGYGGGFENIVFNNIKINGTGLDGIETSRFTSPHKGAAIYTYTGNGSATFNNLTTSNIANPNINLIQNGFNLTINN
ncbi:glycosyl hydrolase [Bacillus sp. FJAT-27264]|uniref:discoidin domain-containing protein n=1 Tax=Paenibacillus sp. (strain DSM 101736 / FJAT-27264) TaxID=1850362 RepID=UPI000807A640|nr:discoidin domain-containing protein [Bacillus sp. FJAT-27264]OBZ14182.1 glycosyl hydrolase [Bacillus sp. FJAT-27264]